MSNSKYGKYIVTQLKNPAHLTPEYNAEYAKWAKRVLYLDDNLIKGAFQMNCSWYCQTPPGKTLESNPHSHDADELIGFFGGNPDKPYDLGAEIEFWIENEQHIITSTAMIFVPRGLKHCPLILRRVDRPIFHFSVLQQGLYKTGK